MDNIKAPNTFMPSEDTNANKLLTFLSDGMLHSTVEIEKQLNICVRSALQQLGGKRLGFWLIHNIGKNSGLYVLDSRHLSGDLSKDMEARVISKKRYTGRSLTHCESESLRIHQAKSDYLEASVAYSARMELVPAEREFSESLSKQLGLFEHSESFAEED